MLRTKLPNICLNCLMNLNDRISILIGEIMKCIEGKCPEFWTSDGRMDCMCACREHRYDFNIYRDDCCVDKFIEKKQSELDILLKLKNTINNIVQS